MRSRFVLLCLLVVVVAGVVAPSVVAADPNPALTARLQAIVDDPVYKLPGLVVLTMQGGEVTYAANLGYRFIDNADPSNNLPIDENSMFRIASISKLVVAIGVMQQVEKGTIDLDRDVGDYLGFAFRNPAYPDTPITARMLLSHTSSVRDGGRYTFPLDVSLADVFLDGGSYWADGEHWAPAGEAPGEYFTYANLGYGILATVLERVTGQLMDTYLRENVLEPLGIDGGYVPALFSQREIDDTGVLYRRSGTRWSPQVDDYRGVVPAPPAGFGSYVPGTNATWQSPQGGLRISSQDLAKVMRMFVDDGAYMGTRILAPKSVELMFAPEWAYDPALENGDTYYDLMLSYGLGPHIMTNSSWDRILEDWDVFMSGHLGEAFGLWSGMMLDRETGDGFIYYVTGRWGPIAYGDYSAFYLTEERIMTALFEEQLLPVESASGMLPPFSADGSSVFRAGASIPLKFQLFGYDGEPYGGMRPMLSLSRWTDGAWGEEFKPRSTSGKRKTTDRFRYDWRSGQYIYNLDTKPMGPGTYRARIAIGAGVQLYAEFSLAGAGKKAPRAAGVLR